MSEILLCHSAMSHRLDLLNTHTFSMYEVRIMRHRSRSETHYSQLRMWQGRTFVLSVASEYEL
jgi:hypothetical protein